MHYNAVVDKKQYDEIVKERDELKHTNVCLKADYENERRLAQKYFEQAAALQRDSGITESAYHKVANMLEACDAELEKLRKEKESMSKSLCEKRERVFDLTVENEKLRLEVDNLTRICSSVCNERDEYREQIKSLRSQLEGASETSKQYAEQAACYRRERDRTYEDAKRHCEDYNKLMKDYAEQLDLKNEAMANARHLQDTLRARNALLQIMFLATGISEEMLSEMFKCRFFTSDASFDADLARRMIQHCISNNGTIIDTLTGYRFDIADRLKKAIEVRDIYGMPKSKPAPQKNEGKEEGTPRPTNAQRRNKGKKKNVRAKPEQSE